MSAEDPVESYHAEPGSLDSHFNTVMHRVWLIALKAFMLDAMQITNYFANNIDCTFQCLKEALIIQVNGIREVSNLRVSFWFLPFIEPWLLFDDVFARPG